MHTHKGRTVSYLLQRKIMLNLHSKKTYKNQDYAPTDKDILAIDWVRLSMNKSKDGFYLTPHQFLCAVAKGVKPIAGTSTAQYWNESIARAKDCLISPLESVRDEHWHYELTAIV